MIITIDNIDYTSSLDATRPPRLKRGLNHASELRFALIAASPQFVVPAAGGRVVLQRTSGAKLFTGYLTEAPEQECLGWGASGAVYHYLCVARSDDALLDHKPMPARAPFVNRTAGDALTQSAASLLPGAFTTAAVDALDVLPSIATTTQKDWSAQATEIAVSARAAWRAHDGGLNFSAAGKNTYALSETDPQFSPANLTLRSTPLEANDVTLTGQLEPRAFVKDYFLGDGLTLSFPLSHYSFYRTPLTIFEEEYAAWPLSALVWTLTDPTAAISVSGGKLQVAGGAGDGLTTIAFVEQIELGGALVFQHGDMSFTAASDGTLGGLYNGAVRLANCLAGFRVTPSGSNSQIQAVINGVTTGTAVTTVTGHRYTLGTRTFATEVYRRQQAFHSSAHQAGNERGGGAIAADVRVVLELHDIDPNNPATLAALSTVLYDGVIAAAPGFASYVPVNATNLRVAVSYTRLLRAVDSLVRSAPPAQAFRTRLTGSLSDGAECHVSSAGHLYFYPPYVPAPNEQIEVTYRSSGRAVARLSDPVSIAAHARGADDGVRGLVKMVALPPPRTSLDCQNAALALLDDAVQPAWSGDYTVCSDWLPGAAADIFPGDALSISAQSRSAVFTAVVRDVEIDALDLATDRWQYKLSFANDAASPLGFAFEAVRPTSPLYVDGFTTTAPATFLADLRNAEVTAVNSTQITIDAGAAPPNGGGFEVRRSDSGWGITDDRNLAGRFTTQAFTVPRLARTQEYYVRQYDGSNPPLYSAHTTVLHVDYPL